MSDLKTVRMPVVLGSGGEAPILPPSKVKRRWIQPLPQALLLGLFSSFVILIFCDLVIFCTKEEGYHCLEQQSFAPSLSPTRHFGYTWCDQRTPSVRLNKMAWSTRFPASAAKSTSGKQGDICRRGSKSTTGIYDSPYPDLRRF